MRWNLLRNLIPHNNSQVTSELRHFINEGQSLFDTDNKYPIWLEEHREELNKKIIEHYAMRQIGFETFGRFKYELNVRMREIMPYYVELWKTTQYEYNPIENYSMEEEFNDLTDSKANSLDKMSDTPQNIVDNIDKHISQATQHDGTGKTDTKHNGWRRGNIGVTTSQQMIQSQRDITINIDMLIIEELNDLFLGVF